ncbi:ABC transporter ATP-binding protein [Sinosporangium siamense]|uniref:ABC transporter ATP-binding protein n=1 Tax=Sinosporangium siamense TaxID=1367973 RepID=UPI001EF1A539|nr:ABC transporter ATP-binding protein [Sinosporangium siamense]
MTHLARWASRAPRETGSERGEWRALLGYAAAERRWLLVGILLGPVGTLGALAQPVAAKAIIDALERGASLWRPVVVLTVLVVAAAALRGLDLWLLERTAERIVRRVRLDLVTRLVRASVPATDRHPVGELTTRVTADTTLLRSGVTHGLVDTLVGAIGMVGAVVFMAVLDVRLLLVAAFVVGATFLGLVVLLPRMRRATEHTQRALGGVGAALERVLVATRTVKASQAEHRELATLAERVEDAYRHGLSFAWLRSVGGVVTGLAVQGAFLVVLAVGGVLVARGELEVSALIAFLLYLFYLAGPIGSLTTGVTQINQALGAVARLAPLAALPQEETSHGLPGGLDGTGAGGVVEFDRVTFAYRADRDRVLDGVTFAVPARGQTAVVGPSGSGKSTLFALLQRFYEPQDGRILLAGRDIRDLGRSELRRWLGYVEQDSPVLDGTLRDNLLYAAPDASEADLRDVVRETRLDELVERLPRGLDTDVGTRGTALSGGERQRVAIARALLRRPEVLLLDEVTAHLDALNEKTLREAVARAAGHCTVIVVAHRLSTVRSARHIVVMERGRVRAQGAHADLMAEDLLYRRLVTTQLTVPSA